MNLPLNYRQLQILKHLITASTPTDVLELVELFNKSERTIRYDINIIRKEIAPYDIALKNKTKRGFYIPAAQKQACAKLVSEQSAISSLSNSSDSTENRYNTLFFLLLCQRQMIPADVIANKLFVSRSTVLRMLASLPEQFGHVFILQFQKSSGYQIYGEEYVLRSIAGSLLATLFKGSYTTEDWYLLLPQVVKEATNLQRIVSITNSIKKINTKHNVWISNTAFIHLLSYCIVREIRLYHNCHVVAMKSTPSLQSDCYASELLEELSSHLPKQGSDEVHWMREMLVNNGIYVNSEKNYINELANGINDFIDVLQFNERKFSYVFDTKSLFDDLYEHLQHYIKLEINHVDIEDNPLLDEIKTKYADFYALATDCAHIFEVRYALVLSETEISYIAIYLYKNLLNTSASKKRVLVVCATGKGLSNLLTTRIKNVFHNLSVVNQVSPYQLDNLMQWKDIDFIISTIPLTNTQIPVVKISKILSSSDIQRIQTFMHYGKLLDNIPFNQNDEASFNSKADPYELLDVSYDSDKSDMASTSIILSKLMLTLLEYTSKFPKEYQMNQDSLLGLIIHMNMAIPRWFTKECSKDEEELILEYYKFKTDHNAVFQIMEKFFQLVEESLMICVPITERFAFFLYIVNEEDNTNE